MSPKYTLNKADFSKISSAFFLSALSALVAITIGLVADIDFGQYTFVIPIINVILYSAKKYLEGR